MNYELALKLKNAGFITTGQVIRGMVFNDSQNECTLFPTLDELIEACGSSFLSLKHFPNGSGLPQGDWIAGGWLKGPVQFCDKTAEMALAKLWLELNKK